MEVLCTEDIGKIEVGHGKVIHRAGVSQDVALFALRQDGRQAGGLAGKFSHARDIHAALAKTLEADLAERVAANAGGEADTIAEKGQVVRENGGRAAQGDAEFLGQVLALKLQLLRQAVKDDVQIELADNADVKSGQGSVPPQVQSSITTRERFLGASGLRFFLTPVKKPSSCAGTRKGASVASSGPSNSSSKSKSLERRMDSFARLQMAMVTPPSSCI